MASRVAHLRQGYTRKNRSTTSKKGTPTVTHSIGRKDPLGTISSFTEGENQGSDSRKNHSR